MLEAKAGDKETQPFQLPKHDVVACGSTTPLSSLVFLLS